MKQTTLNQIENMKKRTFGVELEGNSITRRRAAEVAADFFGTGRYENTAGRNGYMTWSAWDAQGREWKFQKDVSIAGPDDEKCEMVTPVLTYSDMELLQGLCRRLRKAGMKSDSSRMCGIHIHVSGEGFTPAKVRNLVNIMAAHEGQIGRAINLDRSRADRYCRTVDPDFLARVNREKPKTMEKLRTCWYEGNHAEYGTTDHYNQSRYHCLNLHAFFNRYHTFEFRMLQFNKPEEGKRNGIHAGLLKSYIQLCLAMVELADEVKYASPKPQQTDNEKYAMRCWMLRLGFIGEEFATARELLLKNMSGNGAWRQA